MCQLCVMWQMNQITRQEVRRALPEVAYDLGDHAYEILELIDEEEEDDGA